MSMPVALTIAGSDSGGGAGIQADLKTFAALGVYGTSVITALTAQNTRGVSGIHDIPGDFITAQIDAVFSDFDIVAVKIGMVSRPAAIKAIVAALDRWKAQNVVVDPVMVATSGDVLLSPDAIDLVRTELVPRASVVTPNLPEAAKLLDAPLAQSETEVEAQGGRLLDFGAKAVLIKGGHGTGPESTDILITRDAVARLAANRIDTPNTHGTGCTLSSAIAAGLTRGNDLETSVRAAKAYLTAALAAADRLGVGHGHGPVHHFHQWDKS